MADIDSLVGNAKKTYEAAHEAAMEAILHAQHCHDIATEAHVVYRTTPPFYSSMEHKHCIDWKIELMII